MTMLASGYRGKRLNSPNNIVCKSDGRIWFSDPLYGISTDYGRYMPTGVAELNFARAGAVGYAIQPPWSWRGGL